MTGRRRALRRRLALPVGVLALLAVPTLLFAPAGASERAARAAAAQEEGDASAERGRLIYEQACVTCHGRQGEGTRNGPRLTGVGAASVDFYVSTGRMPMPYPGGQSERKPRQYDEQETADLIEYLRPIIAGGPEIPRVQTQFGSIVEGGDLWRANCAACHGYAGRGGALSAGAYAPSIEHSTPVQTVEAMRVGPGQMPVYTEETLPQNSANSIARYVEYLHDPADRGGADLGYNGPIPEGLVIWLVGIVGLVLVSLWVGSTR